MGLRRGDRRALGRPIELELGAEAAGELAERPDDGEDAMLGMGAAAAGRIEMWGRGTTSAARMIEQRVGLRKAATAAEESDREQQ